MIITQNWLKKYIILQANKANSVDIVETLNKIGLEVESQTNYMQIYSKFVIAKIIEASQHPNANKLKICKVHNGREELQIVCGAQNARKGIYTILAPIGTKMPTNEKPQQDKNKNSKDSSSSNNNASSNLVIKESKIRGITSSGMLCGEDELALPFKLKKIVANIPSGSEGIVELPCNKEDIGKNLCEYLGINDVVMNVNIMPNRRRDCSSLKGIARDLAAANLGEFKNYNIENKIKNKNNNYNSNDNSDNNNEITADNTTVNIINSHNINHNKNSINKSSLISDSTSSSTPKLQIISEKDCHEFHLQFFDLAHPLLTQQANTQIINSQLYREILLLLTLTEEAHDLPLVNISNYVMLHIGRPNHFYDADKIKGNIYVRNSFKGEKFLPLKHSEEITLPEGMLVIADDEKILSIAGIIGGELSKVETKTRKIAVEVANFSQNAIIKSGRSLNIDTASRSRFEATVDPQETSNTVDEIHDLIKTLMHGQITSTQYYINPHYQDTLLKKQEILFNTSILSSFANYQITNKECIEILTKLGFKPKNISSYKQNQHFDQKDQNKNFEDKNTKIQNQNIKNEIKHKKLQNEDSIISNPLQLKITIPSWRINDIQNEYDVVEEIIRIKGFDYLNTVSVQEIYGENKQNLHNQKIFRKNNSQIKITEILTSRGLNEVITLPLISKKIAQLFSLSNSIRILNPITEELALMRESLAPSLFQVFENNINRDLKNIEIFEVGKIYLNTNVKPNTESHQKLEIKCAAGIRFGTNVEHNIHNSMRNYDFYDIKDDFLAICNTLNINNSSIKIETNKNPQYYHKGRSAQFQIGNTIIGHCGELDPRITKKLKINHNKNRLYFFEVYIDNLIPFVHKKRKSTFRLSNYPIVKRDIAFVVDETISAQQIIDLVKSLKNNLITDIQIFDSYKINEMLNNHQKNHTTNTTKDSIKNTKNSFENKKTNHTRHQQDAENTKKSIAIRITMLSETHTLKNEEIEKIIQDIIQIAQNKLNAKLRSF